ncbi:MAG: hypothetical protein QT08_C0011G0011 [archaeon GW2011_AR17]|nr:MAG: hypothetical protein QT08_C0011G0011 [archaeon GW2011_AR17]MBS3154469.1 hypothetical protein [Candidatus Woesearchaeota archaeon]HIH15116.1 hypothetical protein [Nanoarchaeota archaeon]HIH59396.1 hypothetical protein [Nanoarchaeota archaeon]HII14516.1 hypothetical protein [Nanoarchaeota archaeon]
MDKNEENFIRLMLSGSNVLTYMTTSVLGHVLENKFLEYNLNDSFLCAAAYIGTSMGMSKEKALLTSIGIASFFEYIQKIDIKSGGAGYDPKDFAAYIIGASLAYTLDNLLTKQNP